MLAPSIRPFLRTACNTAPRYAFPRSNIIRSMSSTTAPLQEWLVIVPDHEGALQKRLTARPDHLSGLKKDDESFWLWGGMLSSWTVCCHFLEIAFLGLRSANG